MNESNFVNHSELTNYTARKIYFYLVPQLELQGKIDRAEHYRAWIKRRGPDPDDIKKK